VTFSLAIWPLNLANCFDCASFSGMKHKTEHILVHKDLGQHPLYAAIDSLDALRGFMERHVYAVWDFMALLKYLQSEFAPASWPWFPPDNPKAARLVNEIILGEESDIAPSAGSASVEHCSHFEIYLAAMSEVEASTSGILSFVSSVRQGGLENALSNWTGPASAFKFLTQTFELVEKRDTLAIASAFAAGREAIVPVMFKGILTDFSIDRSSAPAFHYYLERHILVDGDSHGPAAAELVECLCGSNSELKSAAALAADNAIRSRRRFWDQILKEIRPLEASNVAGGEGSL